MTPETKINDILPTVLKVALLVKNLTNDD